MAGTVYKKSGGRDVLVSLVEKVAELAGDGSTTSLTVGTWYVATSKAESSSAIDDFKVGIPFLAKTAITLETGDDVVELTDLWGAKQVIGFSNSKSLSFSKSSFDVTTDSDDFYDKITEEQVEISGSFDGFKLLGVQDEDNAIVKLNRQFTDVLIQDGTTDKVLERTNEVLYLAFLYKKGKPSTGDTVDISFTPVNITSGAESSSYGSGNTQNISFEGANSSDFGALPAKAVVTY